MDVPRRPSPLRTRAWLWGLAPLSLVAAGYGVHRLEKAAPIVERESLYLGTVERGPLTFSVRGTGSLIPEHVRWVTAENSGRVDEVAVEAGVRLDADDVLVVLSNDDLELKALEAQRELTSAQAELVNLRAQLETDRLTQKAKIATAQAELRGARRTLKAHEELAKDGLITTLELEGDRDRVLELDELLGIEGQRLALFDQVEKARVAAQESQVERLDAIASFCDEQLASLIVRAGSQGVLQELPLEVGQWIEPGTLIAKVVRPDRLKAVVRIAQSQANDIQVGQQAVVDMRIGEVEGRVSRIDPSVQDGSVNVDLSLDEPLPHGARPDMNIEATIELARVEDTLHMGRPAFGQANGTAYLFVLNEDETEAIRVPIQLGRSSVRAIEVVAGVEPGARIVLGDMSRYEGEQRLRID